MNGDQETPVSRRRPGGRWMVWAVLAVLVGVYLYANRTVPAAFEWEANYEAGLRKAGEQGKFVLLAFQTAGCPACQWMDREVFSKSEVARALEGWVAVRVDGNREPRLALEYRVEAFPTFFVLSPAGQVVAGFMGTRPADQFIQFLEKARAKDLKGGPTAARGLAAPLGTASIPLS
jgi:thioredoxin-like negative regulator of GroEL